MNNIRTKNDLIQEIDNGYQPNFLMFWGHRKPKTGVAKTCFSQWYEASFKLDGQRYPTAEHYMMAEKARLFKDEAAEKKVLQSSQPGDAKKAGRGVKGFVSELWDEKRFAIVVTANLAKFGQNPELKKFLLATGDQVIVEASPVDAIWGIGLAADAPQAQEPKHWKGENLLGFALMEVRSQLADSY